MKVEVKVEVEVERTGCRGRYQDGLKGMNVCPSTGEGTEASDGPSLTNAIEFPSIDSNEHVQRKKQLETMLLTLQWRSGDTSRVEILYKCRG